jgi:spermidine synthase
MDWFTENWTPNIRFSVKIKEHIFHEKTPFQTIDVYDSYDLGRFFTLDGIMMASEKDEFIYHEMIVHTPFSVNPHIRKVLVIGGGDGGSIREIVKYPTVSSIDMVEIDKKVVEVCQMYFKTTTSGFSDSRVHLHIEDGLEFVRTTNNEYDLIIVDSTDPSGPGEGLFTLDFYKNCHRILTDDGILINQHESPYFERESKEMKRAHEKIKATFLIAKVYQAFIPTYPSGHWLFGFASKKLDPVKHINEAHINIIGHITKYYNKDLHIASFSLPNYVIDILNQE